MAAENPKVGEMIYQQNPYLNLFIWIPGLKNREHLRSLINQFCKLYIHKYGYVDEQDIDNATIKITNAYLKYVDHPDFFNDILADKDKSIRLMHDLHVYIKKLCKVTAEERYWEDDVTITNLKLKRG